MGRGTSTPRFAFHLLNDWNVLNVWNGWNQLIRRILIPRQALFILTISLSRSRSVLICGSNYIRFVERTTRNLGYFF